MKKKYYFLTLALPELRLDEKPDISFADLSALLEINLSRQDFLRTVTLRNFYDLENARLFWLRRELNEYGFLDRNALEETLISRLGVKEYVFDFLARYRDAGERLENFPRLLVRYFSSEIKQAEGFLKSYLTFERGWRLTMLGFRAKKSGRDVAFDLRFEDPYDDLTAQILAQKDAQKYEPPVDFRDLKSLFEKNFNEPLKLEQEICRWRFAKIVEMEGANRFEIDSILSYLARFIIIDALAKLDRKAGLKKVEKII